MIHCESKRRRGNLAADGPSDRPPAAWTAASRSFMVHGVSGILLAVVCTALPVLGLVPCEADDLSQKEEVADLVRKDLLRVNSYLPEPARVQRFVLLHKEFDADEAELTRTRKIRREFMEERYKELIESMYGNGNQINVQAPVTYRDGRKGFVSTSIKVRDIS